jgi:acetyltransferase-like isoleucine patch superfamily enzyme
MNPIAWCQRRFGATAAVGWDRLRAFGWTLRGARLGAKARIGRSCIIDRPWTLSTGERVQVEHAVYLKAVDDSARIVLGEHTFIGFGTELDVALTLTIGRHVLIAPGCFITDHAHARRAGTRIDDQGTNARAVMIGDDAWLGARVVVLAGVRIGDGAIVAGVPARVIGQRRP